MMKRQFNRMRQQLSHPNITSRAQEATELLPEDLLQIEQRIEPAKRAAHSVSKRLQACLQGQCGSEMDKRVKKLPLMTLSTTMAESFKELDTESSLGKALEMGCCIQSSLAKILAEFEIAVERDVLQPLNKLSEEELPIILKRKKTLQKLISDWNAIKSRLNQAAKSSSNSAGTGAGPGASSAANKLEILKEEEEEVKRKVEQCKDEYMADLYHFSTKEDSYASYFIKLLEIQAQYHRQSLGSLDSALAELKESHSQTEPTFTADAPVAGYYGVPLETHLKSLGREIALPIEACVMMLLASGMREEGLFRLAAGASVLRKLKSSLASGSNALEEFYSDPHAVAGALKSYLRELPQPLMTFELYNEWVEVASLKDVDSRLQRLQDTCSRLPQESYNNLRYLIKFLAKLAEHQEVNKMTPSNIAIVLGPNLLWSQQNTGDPMQLDLASVSSIQVVGVVEALIQNADVLFPGEVDFNVSGMFTPPANGRLGEATPVEELTPKPPPASTPTLPDGEVTSSDPEPRSQPTSPAATRPSPEAAGPLPPTMTENTTCKGKRPAPARPTMPPPPPVAQPRTAAPTPAAPEHAASPKAQPRRMAGVPSRPPAVPPPLPPQPARRHSRDAPPSPRPPAGGEADAATATDCAPGAADEGQRLPAGRSSPPATLPPEEN
ncbi:SH3 domain-binding protein 1 [Aquila chrysaetos chrysaetos]|uniref:SH3 domain binding protein 1 n=2 Tax=Accipitrinae TaxID=8955 RepID=A0A663E9A8_AQUCH|nr:SH3 domain-binding protein 1 [Aquila chrysaetos chrysaetos]